MKKHITIALAISIIVLVLGLGYDCYGADDIKTAVTGNTDFALILYGKLKDDPNTLSSGGNLFFSPYSISTALAMTYGGARGKTKEQMADALHFQLPDQNLHSAFGSLQKKIIQEDKSRGYQIFLANSLWGQKGETYLKEFLNLAQTYYGGGFNQLDFVNEPEPSRKTINYWVEEKTKNKIKELIPSSAITQDTVLVLANAIYFKGEWKTKFSARGTQKADFTVYPNSKVEVPMMYLKKEFKYYDDANLQAIELPYKSDEISMLVILPREIEGFKKTENTFTTENLNMLISKMQESKVYLCFPKFKMTWGSFYLNNILNEMGMPDAFNPRNADFSGITGNKNIWISAILHKAFIEVDEKGTKASASTSVVLTLSADYPETPIFRADHPFIFIIKDNRSGSILFMGRLMNPAN